MQITVKYVKNCLNANLNVKRAATDNNISRGENCANYDKDGNARLFS